MTEPRQIDVPRDRLERWVAGFAQRHGEPTWNVRGNDYLVSAPNGAWATFSSWIPAQSLPPDLVAWSKPPVTFAIILIRRGGYAVGIVKNEKLVAHKCGTRYVQSRTAAGGWSQQRYARRRENQRDDLVGTVIQRASAISQDKRCSGVVLGGDRALVATVRGDPSLRGLDALPCREFFDIPDPRMSVLAEVHIRATAIAISVSNA
ncbi:MAG: acVLRF1 family peptidyl-tRNA hydrolase [Ornithinimicrobium sp.]